MKSLKERLAARKAEFDAINHTDKVLQDFINTTPIKAHLFNIDVSPYARDGFIYLNCTIESIEYIELELIPLISTSHNIKWSKYVGSDGISYLASFYYSRKDIYLTINVKIDDSCIIHRVPTGKTTKVDKIVRVEEPEFEILIDCN